MQNVKLFRLLEVISRPEVCDQINKHGATIADPLNLGEPLRHVSSVSVGNGGISVRMTDKSSVFYACCGKHNPTIMV